MDSDHIMFLQDSFEATVSKVEPTAAAFSAVSARDMILGGKCIILPACFV